MAHFKYYFNICVENVVHIIEAILMEQRTLLMSENIRILAPIGEALLALIFHLQWQFAFIYQCYQAI